MIRNFGMIRVVVHQGPVGIVGILKIEPLRQCLLDGVSAVAVEGHNVPGFLNGGDFLPIGPKVLGIGFLADGHILKPQGVNHRAAHQQQCQGNDGGNQQRFPKRDLPGSERGVFRLVVVSGVNRTQNSQQFFSVHAKIPSLTR